MWTAVSWERVCLWVLEREVSWMVVSWGRNSGYFTGRDVSGGGAST